MAIYAISNPTSQQAMTSSYKTILTLVSSATLRRTKIFDLMFGTNGTPADNNLEFDISRISSADGTGGALTPSPLDAADGAALSTTKQNYTVEPTGGNIGVQLWYEAINQRASFRWVCQPKAELVTPATSGSGVVFRARSASGYTGTVAETAYFEEQ